MKLSDICSYVKKCIELDVIHDFKDPRSGLQSDTRGYRGTAVFTKNVDWFFFFLLMVLINAVFN